ncbi:hypothetical protein B0H14DRAFT_2331739 [Mycena olivaceomarginata]|nr:hypothetical protein B0H14DRAFT_2331739 [Mycena olivaceomarginata]
MNFARDDRVACLSASGGGAKRTSRTTRRINTAERRATHNAVERQRRKTLNERFLVSPRDDFDIGDSLMTVSTIRNSPPFGSISFFLGLFLDW